MLREIDLRMLVPNPEQTNHMDAELLLKLRRHIEQTGRYEPLTVRPHSTEKGKFQVINGHNRLRVLRALAHKSAFCIVWDIDDEQTRLYLGTLNQLSGDDVPERRSLLVETLLHGRSVDEPSALLPDRKSYLAELERLARLELDDLLPSEPTEESASGVPVILEFMLDETAATEINLALDLIVNAGDGTLSRGQRRCGSSPVSISHVADQMWSKSQRVQTNTTGPLRAPSFAEARAAHMARRGALSRSAGAGCEQTPRE